ncbi:MAG: tetratricopeptide repeat protein [Microcystaceae cyanobacterium]
MRRFLPFILTLSLIVTPQIGLTQTVNQLFQQGNTAQAAGNYTKAELIFRRVIEIEPNAADAYNNLGIALYYQGKLEEATISFRIAIQLNPNSATAYYNLGNTLRKQGKLEEATISFRIAIQLNPYYTYAYQNLGDALSAQGKYEEAITNYQMVLSLPNQQGTNQQGIPVSTHVLAYQNLGNALYYQGKLEEAIESYRKAIQLNPYDASTYINLGLKVYFPEGRLEEAIKNVRIAIQLNPDNSFAYTALGVVLDEQGKYEEAIESYRQAIQLNPDDAHAHAYVGLGNTLLFHQEKLEEAIENYKKALAIDPNYTIAQNNLKEAERLLALKTAPNSPIPIDDRQYLPSINEEPLVPYLRSTAHIIVSENDKTGAGWVMKREGDTVWIVTNRHVLSDIDSIEVEFYSELSRKQRPRYPATLEKMTSQNESLDLAVIKVTGIPDDIKPLTPKVGKIRLNSIVIIIGHPVTVTNPWVAVRGTVAAISYEPDSPEISLDATVAQGNSGGPVINEKGEIIAMMVSLYTRNDVAADPNVPTPIIADTPATGGVGLAYRIDIIMEKLKEWGY